MAYVDPRYGHALASSRLLKELSGQCSPGWLFD